MNETESSLKENKIKIEKLNFEDANVDIVTNKLIIQDQSNLQIMYNQKECDIEINSQKIAQFNDKLKY